MKKNTWFSNPLRREVAIRDRGICYWCKKKADYIKSDQWKIPRFYEKDGTAFEHDHIIAEKDGGKTTVENVVLSCRHCNRTRRRISKTELKKIKELEKEFPNKTFIYQFNLTDQK